MGTQLVISIIMLFRKSENMKKNIKGNTINVIKNINSISEVMNVRKITESVGINAPNNFGIYKNANSESSNLLKMNIKFD